MDPPYVPISDTSNFTSYTKDDFGEKEQLRLKYIVDQLNHKKCKILISNSFCEFILDLYKEYNINTVNARRAINSVGSKRGIIQEVLITNY